jgi:hypothetical protein
MKNFGLLIGKVLVVLGVFFLVTAYATGNFGFLAGFFPLTLAGAGIIDVYSE